MRRHFRNTWGLTLGQYVSRQRSATIGTESSREREAV